jgi:peptide/nickel transport system substrate-binding protein
VLRTAVAVLACGALTTACGGSGGGTGGSGDAGRLAEEGGEPQDGGVLNMAATAEALSLDPHRQAAYTVHGAVGSVYSRLVAFKTGPDEDYGTNELESDLAETWETPDDGTTWTFKLRQGVQFHDKPPLNGREFTSADVLCTMDRIQTLPGHQRGLLSNVTDITAPDDYTVTFTLARPFIAFDETLANPFLVILPCEATNGGFDPALDAIGTGPFVLESWKRDQERVYVKNENYFEEGLPHLDGYTVTMMPDAQAQIAALRSGKIDMISALSTEKRQVDALVSQIDGLQLLEEPGTTQTRVYMNAESAPFDSLEVRRAIAMAIDKQGMVDTIRSGGQLSGPITPSLFGALPDDEVEELIPYDPEGARQMLADAGFPDGFPVTMVVTTGYGETIPREAQWVQEDLAEVGIDVTLDVQDYATYIGDTWPNGKYDIAYGLQTPMLSADEYLSTEWLSTGTRNWSNVNDPELDEMINAQKEIADPEERETALQDIERYIMENVSTPLPLYVYTSQTLLGENIRGYHPHPDYSTREYQDIWLAQD